MKHIEDMIVPERKRTIRNIPIPESRRKLSDVARSFSTRSESTPPPPQTSLEPDTQEYDFHRTGARFPRLPGKKAWIAIGLGAMLVFIFILLSIFDGATFSYTPKSAAVSFEGEEYSATKSGAGLIFSVIKLSKDKGKSLSASGEAEVSRKSSGTIVVYNNATREPQKLRATTRFETSDGKVYRTQNDISVPGKKLVNGKEEPGSIEVMVYADKPGAEYNIGLSDFTLPGLKGGSLFSNVYARSKTPMTGGFVGTEKAISEVDKANARAELEESLKAELLSEARAQSPEGFVILPDLSSFSFEELPQTESSNRSSATFNLRGNLEGVMLKAVDLSTHLAREKAALAPGDLIDLFTLEELDFAFAEGSSSRALSADEINFTVSGSATAVWRTDETALKSDLLGKSKKEINAILNNYPTVESANVALRPFWKTSFPRDGEDILIKKLDVK